MLHSIIVAAAATENKNLNLRNKTIFKLTYEKDMFQFSNF